MSLRKLNLENGALLSMYLVTCLSVLWPTYSMYLGTILFLLMAYLSMSSLFVYTIPLVFILNDGLGTALMGHVSFYWVSLLLTIWNWLYTRKGALLSMKAGVFLGGGMFYVAYLYFVQYVGAIREPVRTLVFFLLMTFVIEEVHLDRTKLREFFFHIGLSCAIAALHMAVIGGVDYTSFSFEDASGDWVRASRYGLLGAGSGDPNFSSLNILIGCICVFYSNMNAVPKYGIITVMLYCLIKTVSITSVVILLGVVSCIILLENSSAKKLKYICLVILVAVVVIHVFTTMPLGGISEQAELLAFRIETKLQQMATGEYGEVTTGRTDNALANLVYSFSRNPFKIIFGMDRTPPPNVKLSHNTYVDVIIRFGVVGAICIFVLVGKVTRNALKKRVYDGSVLCTHVIVLKILYFAYAFTLSIYNGPELVLMVWMLFVL